MKRNKGGSNISGITGTMTFKQVQHYLNSHDSAHAEYAEANKIGKVTLASLKNQFKDNEAEIDQLRYVALRPRVLT